MKKILEKLLINGVKQGVFPGAVAAVSQLRETGITRITATAGVQDNRYPEIAATEKTVFDLASLTKALSTTLIIYSLVYEKKIGLHKPIQSYFAENIEKRKQSLTVEQLLSHSSGLPAYVPFYKKYKPEKKYFDVNKQIIEDILAGPLEYEPGEKCIYSDLGFILLGHIIECVTGEDIRTNFIKYVTIESSRSEKLFFNPPGKNKDSIDIYASTENCPWRERIINGEVHDEHCWLMGGSAGHAGLFGVIEGVVELCERILYEWKYGGKKYAWSHMLSQGLQRKYSKETWCLGFDTPSSVGSSGGRKISPASVGHLGFTGTSFWIDPERALVMVLLTNRVHQSRENKKIKKYRPYFHTAILDAADNRLP